MSWCSKCPVQTQTAPKIQTHEQLSTDAPAGTDHWHPPQAGALTATVQSSGNMYQYDDGWDRKS